LEINKNCVTSKKEISAKSTTSGEKYYFGPMAPRRPWRQVIPNYSRRQGVFRVKKSRQAVQRHVSRVKMSRTRSQNSAT